MANISNQSQLYIQGVPKPLDTSCPILDQNAAIQIPDSLITVYQDRIDALINQLGKNVELEFTPKRTECINCKPDPIRNRSTGIYKTVGPGPRPFISGRQCPYCKGAGFLKTRVTKCIQALLKWNPRDLNTFGISINESSDIVRVKTFLSLADDIKRAQSAIIDINIKNILKLKVKRIRGPIPTGLRESRYCVSFWQIVKE